MIVELADALVAHINEGEYSQDLTAVRVDVPQFKLEDMGTLHVTIVPREIEDSIATRGQDEHVIRIDIGIQKRFPARTLAQVDAMMALVREIAARVNRINFKDDDWASNAVWMKTDNKPIYDPAGLREKDLFTSVLTVTYRMQS